MERFSAVPPSFPSGTSLPCFNSTAPVGWTKQTTHDDKALRLVTGTPSSGGSTAFSSVFGSSKTTGSHAITNTESAGLASSFSVAGGAGPRVTGYDGSSGVGHTHTLSLDPNFVDMIMINKD